MSTVPADLVKRHLTPPPETVLDIGCGIRPQRVVAPRLHVGVDAHGPYLERVRQSGFRGVLVEGAWDAVLSGLADDSFDAVFALDAIEHWPKEDGRLFLDEARRVASTVVIFTPDGPFPQSYEDGETDAWGMDGGFWQTHRSAWTPEDFEGWTLYELPGFHKTDAAGRSLPEPIGAFWAVWGHS